MRTDMKLNHFVQVLVTLFISLRACRVSAKKHKPLLNNPCLDSRFQSFRFCSQNLSYEVRVADILERLTLQEKVLALGTNTGPLPSIGLDSYNWWSEAAHGISRVRNDNTTPYQTNFPLPITLGASYNRLLWRDIGHQIALEARAFMNAGNAYSTFW